LVTSDPAIEVIERDMAFSGYLKLIAAGAIIQVRRLRATPH
jgi:hypothetical protein